jgi:signal transduction histidine kinase
MMHAEEAIKDIRRLVYDLRPPALDDLGLVGSLREWAARYSQNGLQVTVEAPQPMPPLPAAVEVASYRIVQEALTNVARHACTQTCTIRLEVDDLVRLEIADRGVGLPLGYRAGVGVLSMRERAAELGGFCTLEARPGGGTIVRAHLPLWKDG